MRFEDIDRDLHALRHEFAEQTKALQTASKRELALMMPQVADLSRRTREAFRTWLAHPDAQGHPEYASIAGLAMWFEQQAGAHGATARSMPTEATS